MRNDVPSEQVPLRGSNPYHLPAHEQESDGSDLPPRSWKAIRRSRCSQERAEQLKQSITVLHSLFYPSFLLSDGFAISIFRFFALSRPLPFVSILPLLSRTAAV